MYTLALVLALAAIVLSPIALDSFLTYRETRRERQALRALQSESPRLAWASRAS